MCILFLSLLQVSADNISLEEVLHKFYYANISDILISSHVSSLQKCNNNQISFSSSIVSKK